MKRANANASLEDRLRARLARILAHLDRTLADARSAILARDPYARRAGEAPLRPRPPGDDEPLVDFPGPPLDLPFATLPDGSPLRLRADEARWLAREQREALELYRADCPPGLRGGRRSPKLGPGEWWCPYMVKAGDSPIPLPFTVGDALDFTKTHAEEIVRAVAAEIRATAEAVIPDETLRRAVLARDVVTKHWPLASAHSGPIRGPLRLLEYSASDDAWPQGEPRYTMAGPWIHPDAAPGEVARWAREGLNALTDPEWLHPWTLPDDVNQDGTPGPARPWGDALLREAEGRGGSGFAAVYFIRFPSGARAAQPDSPRTVYSSAGLALLFLAEKPARAIVPRPIQAPPLDVTRPTVRAVAAVSGVDPRTPWKDGRLSRKQTEDIATPVSLVFRWEDGEKTQVDLPLYDDPSAGALVAVAHRYGSAAVRDLLGLYAFAWAREARPGPWWWWPVEHLELTGLASNRDNREAVLARVGRLNRTRLEAHYESGAPLVGPLVSCLLTDGTARKLALHDSLYGGIRGRDGERGNYFWPMPMALLKLPADRTSGNVHALAVVAGSLFRAKLGTGTDPTITAGRLAGRLAIRGNTGERSHDARVEDTLRRTLEAGVSCDLLGDYDVDGPGLGTPSSVIRLSPGNEALRILTSGLHPYPAHVPATGDELAEWLHLAELTVTEAGARLAIDRATLGRAVGYGARPLSPNVRAALRRFLWGGASED